VANLPVLRWQLLTPGGRIKICAVAQFAAEGKLPLTRVSSPRNSDAIAMIHSLVAARRSIRRSAGLEPALNPISGRPRGFTLIEMLVALAATLLMMGATVTLFGVIVDSVSGSRALLEMSDKLRATRNRIQADLQGATATMKPPLRPENDEGYLEIVEGGESDGNHPSIANTLFGDTDDALLLTVRSRGEPFVGKFNTITMESQVAEVLYFLKQNGPIIDATTSPPLRLCTLYRRALLVVPGQQAVVAGGNVANPFSTLNPFYNLFDVSARVEAGVRVANTLGDLTKPENRIGHQPTGVVFPFRFYPSIDPTLAPSAFDASSNRLGDDILMTNVLSFDVQVYDPGAPVFEVWEEVTSPPSPPRPIVAVEPRDERYLGPQAQGAIVQWINANYPLPSPPPPPPLPPPLLFSLNLPPTPPPPRSYSVRSVAFGAYADLGYLTIPPPYTNTPPPYSPPAGAGIPASQFGGVPDPKSGIAAPRSAVNPYVYDTWSLHYENNGLDEDGAMGPDAATNGLDDAPTNGIVDDIGERDTMPPYSAPLRGVRITIRVYEPSSLQVRQVTIVQDFLPE
jgi:prepilin-type N-terminal cleavage/methylation domain-containing protein